MPDEVPSEVTPHILRAFEDFPDQPGLVTWIYPFDEYHDWTFDSRGNSSRIGEVFFGDWFMRAAINQGFPLNTVASTRCFLEALRARPGLFHDTILACPAPDAGTPLADALCAHVENGGSLLLYGPLACLDPRLAALLGVSLEAPLGGDLDLTMSLRPDELENGAFPARMKMRELLSGGGADVAIPASGAGVEVLAEVGDGGQKRAFALSKSLPGGGHIAWLRGAFCGEVIPGEHLPKQDDPEQWFPAERLMRWMLQVFDIVLRFHKPTLQTPDPLILAARKRNGFFFSGYSPSTCVALEWRLPHGVPVPVGCDVKFSNGTGTMILPRAWHRECRVFVEQKTGEVTCREQFSGEIGVTRRLLVRGLHDATVRFLPDTGFPLPASITLNDAYWGLGTPVPFQTRPDSSLTVEAITGELLISW
jgi:hypothetical protein